MNRDPAALIEQTDFILEQGDARKSTASDGRSAVIAGHSHRAADLPPVTRLWRSIA